MISLVDGGGRSPVAPIFRVRVSLAEILPPIWRTLDVPASANLGWVHAALQLAMGWNNSHLHLFVCGDRTYSDPEFEMDQEMGAPPVVDESIITLAELMPNVGDAIAYEYDFGDGWEHSVTLEEILPAGPARKKPIAICVAGQRACPPDDCGGPFGYEDLLMALKDRKHPRHRELKDWIGGNFDSEHFDLARVNKKLARLTWPNVSIAQLRKILLS